MPAQDPPWYAGVEEFTRLYRLAGFTEIQAELIPRPTPLPGGVAGWVKTFRAGLTGRRRWCPNGSATTSPPRSRRGVAPALRQPDGSWCADYVRLRFSMRKPG